MIARTALVTHPDALRHDTGPGHPERPERVAALLDALRSDAALRGAVAERTGRHATDEELLRVHTPEHLDRVRAAVDRAARTGHAFLDSDTVVSAASFDAARAAAGSVCVAVDLVAERAVANAFCAVRPPGHHATADRAMGFCLFNNVAVGVRYAQARWSWRRAVIVDWDLHHGNGTQEIFYEDADVHYVSVHQSPLYPGTGAAHERGRGPGLGRTTNLPQPPGRPPDAIVADLLDAIDRVAAEFRPDAVFVSAGFDAAGGDPLGQLTLRPADFATWTARLLDWAASACEGRVISVLEGGYALANLRACGRAHVRTLASVQPAVPESP